MSTFRSGTSQSSSYPIVLTRLGGPRSRPNPHLKPVEVPGIEPATSWSVVSKPIYNFIYFSQISASTKCCERNAAWISTVCVWFVFIMKDLIYFELTHTFGIDRTYNGSSPYWEAARKSGVDAVSLPQHHTQTCSSSTARCHPASSVSSLTHTHTQINTHSYTKTQIHTHSHISTHKLINTCTNTHKIKNVQTQSFIRVCCSLFHGSMGFFFYKPSSSPPPGYLGHSAHTPGSFSMSYIKTLFKMYSYESVYGLARLHTTYITKHSSTYLNDLFLTISTIFCGVAFLPVSVASRWLPAIFSFVDQKYRYKLVVIQIPVDAELTPITYTDRRFLLPRVVPPPHSVVWLQSTISLDQGAGEKLGRY